MAALTKDRATPERDGRRVSDPVAPGKTIYAGALYSLDATGRAVPAGDPDAAGFYARAVAVRRASALDGDERVEGAFGVFRFDNDTAAPITAEDVANHVAAIVVDDHTVGKGGSEEAGVVVALDDAGVWVRVGV